MKKQIKILILGENFFPLSTASAQRLFAFSKILASHSYQTIVITKSQVSFKSKKMTVIGLNHKIEVPILNPMLLFFYLIRSMLILSRHRIDLIISTVPKINNTIAGFLLSELFGIPHLIDVRDYWEGLLLTYPGNKFIPNRLAFLLVKMTSFIYRRASSLVTVNETLIRMLRERGVPYDRIFQIPNGIDTSLFRPCTNETCVKQLRKKYMLPPSKTIFLYAGSLGPHHKFDLVLKAVNRLSGNNNFMFLIVGRPLLLMSDKKILQTIEKLKLKKNVKMMGPLPVDKMAELLRCCNVGVIALDDDEIWRCMTTVKLLSYLASGLPVLASGPKDGELENLINQHKVGFFVRETTPERFVEGIKFFLQEKSRTKSMGLKGRRIMEEFYDRYALSRKIMDVIHHIVNSPRSDIYSGDPKRKDGNSFS